MRTILMAVLIVGGLAAGAITGMGTASAATKSVTVTINDWNCRANGKYDGNVARVLIDVVPSTSGQPGWIGGKTRSGIAVPYPTSGGKSATVAATIFCQNTWWGGGYYRELSFGKWIEANTSTNWSF